MPFAIPLIPLITAGAALIGTGLSAYGAMQSTKAAKEQAQYQQQIAAAQQRQEELRRKQMELDARRKNLEAVRNAQRARALALAAATNQGAQFGSGLAGGYGQISGESNTNLLGISQGLQLGRANFAESANITSAKYGYAGASSDAAAGQGFSSLGGSFLQIAPIAGNLFGSIGGSSGGGSSSNYNPYYGSGSSYGAVY